jgi:hypothetical protein
LRSYASPEQIILQTAALRADRTPTQASFFQLDLSLIDSTWDELVAGVTWAAEVLEEEGVFDDQRLPTVTVLPVLAALYKSLPTKLDDYANARARIANREYHHVFPDSLLRGDGGLSDRESSRALNCILSVCPGTI